MSPSMFVRMLLQPNLHWLECISHSKNMGWISHRIKEISLRRLVRFRSGEYIIY
ncbi:hypothetical protein B7760_06008 (plasmid) [Burkholderia glumae]|nr:hypothetical protein B7760_06008 [Burkholderia glumae]QKM57726.1 hypothetical protein CG017_05806 [Burkholderia glumae]QTP37188.1 hypothetical protein B7759_05830 [Burkholderia glumae]